MNVDIDNNGFHGFIYTRVTANESNVGLLNKAMVKNFNLTAIRIITILPCNSL